MALKHIGRVIKSKRKCLVAYRTLPGDPHSALIIPTEALPSEEHDSLMSTVESPGAQQAYEFAESLSRSYFPDGREMLKGLHLTGQLRKVSTTEIEMTPDTQSSIPLNELNEIIAQQKGVPLSELALKGPDSDNSSKAEVVEEKPLDNTEFEKLYGDLPTNQEAVPPMPVQQQTTEDPVAEPFLPLTEEVTNDELAKQLRSHASKMFKEAKALREKADELAPPKKVTKKKVVAST